MVGSYGSYVLASGIPPSIPAFRYEPIFALPVVLLALVVWRVIVLRRRGAADDVHVVLIGAAWFVVALLPLASLPVDLNNANGERNLLLASVGLALAVAGLIPVPRRVGATVAAGAAICGLGALTLYNSFDWIEAGRLSKRLVPAAAAMAPPGGELILLSQPEGYRTAHVFIGGDLSREFRYRGIDKTVAFCAPVELRAVRPGEVRFSPSGSAYRGGSGWSAAFDFPVLHSAAGLTGECSYARSGGPSPPGLGLRALVTPNPSRKPVVYAYFDGREHGTAFYQGKERKPYNPDFAAWARAAGVEGLTVTKSQDFKGALEHAVKLGKPCLIDVHVDANIRPPGTGAWALPPIPHKEPIFGKKHHQGG